MVVRGWLGSLRKGGGVGEGVHVELKGGWVFGDILLSA